MGNWAYVDEYLSQTMQKTSRKESRRGLIGRGRCKIISQNPRIFKIGLINRLTTVLLIALHNIWYSNQLSNIRLF